MPKGKPINLTGVRFGRLSVQGLERTSKSGRVWRCICACGNSPPCFVMTGNLTSGQTTSCGCYNSEIAAKRLTVHGARRNKTIQPLYRVWLDMNNRCSNPNNKDYNNYGRRNIIVCDAWKKSYTAFRDFMISLPNCPKNILIHGTYSDYEIDRYPDNDGNYEPGNVRWATLEQQANNKRTNLRVVVYGKTMTLAEAIREYPYVPYNTAFRRLKMGWPVERALSIPNPRPIIKSTRDHKVNP